MVDEKKSKYQYVIIMITASLFIAIAGALFVGKPLYANIKNSEQERAEKSLTLEKLENKLAVLKNLESRQEELVEKNKKTLSAIPTDKDIARLFMQFEKVANSSSVYINTVQEQEDDFSTNENTEVSVTLPNTIFPVTHHVTAESSSYGNLKKALKNFEESLRILSIEQVSLSRESDAGGKLKINLTIKTYKRS
jgi:Tfp pilus assembly protein PilO